MKEKVRDIITAVLLHVLWIFPVDTKKIIFKSFRGQNFGDNPGAIYSELSKRRPDLKYYWAMKNNSVKIPGATVIKNGSIAELYHLATSKIWIDNKRKGMWCSKRKGQYYLQTWHGGISMKKVEGDAAKALSEYYLKNAAKDSHNADLFLSDSKWTTECYRRAFYYNGEILEKGLPRSDKLFAVEKDEIRKKVCERLGINYESRVLLYAPTFRVDGKLEAYNVDFSMLFKSLEERFGGRWTVLIRLHPNIAGKCSQLIIEDSNVKDASMYDDINELIVASEIMITDYSSCMFDAMVAGAIVFLYAVDIKEYDEDRGRYFEFEELPYPLATNNEELEKNIMDYSEDVYMENVESFQEKLGIFPGGNATATVCDRLEEVLRT